MGNGFKQNGRSELTQKGAVNENEERIPGFSMTINKLMSQNSEIERLIAELVEENERMTIQFGRENEIESFQDIVEFSNSGYY